MAILSDFGEYLLQVVFSCPAWAQQSSGTGAGARRSQPWQLSVGVLVAPKGPLAGLVGVKVGLA